MPVVLAAALAKKQVVPVALASQVKAITVERLLVLRRLPVVVVVALERLVWLALRDLWAATAALGWQTTIRVHRLRDQAAAAQDRMVGRLAPGALAVVATVQLTTPALLLGRLLTQAAAVVVVVMQGQGMAALVVQARLALS